MLAIMNIELRVVKSVNNPIEKGNVWHVNGWLFKNITFDGSLIIQNILMQNF